MFDDLYESEEFSDDFDFDDEDFSFNIESKYNDALNSENREKDLLNVISLCKKEKDTKSWEYLCYLQLVKDSLKSKNVNNFKKYFEILFSLDPKENSYQEKEAISQIFDEIQNNLSFLSDIVNFSLKILRKLKKTNNIMEIINLLKKNNYSFVFKYGNIYFNDNNDIKNKDDNHKDDYENEIKIAILMSKENGLSLAIEKSIEEEENKQIQSAIIKSIEEEKELKILNKKEENNYINNPYYMDINEHSFFDNKNEENFDEDFDEDFGICPITLEYMKNPVFAPSGYYYEKSAIIDWIKRNNNDPFTREYLSEDMLVEDNVFKQKIIEYRLKFNKF